MKQIDEDNFEVSDNELLEILEGMTPDERVSSEFVQKSSNLCITANGTIFRTDIEGIFPAILGRWADERIELQRLKNEWKEKRESAVTENEIQEADEKIFFYDMRQQAKKVLMNSFYGSILNPACRFHDERIGQSVTLSGRTITKHMNATINQLITSGEYLLEKLGNVSDKI